MTAIEWLVEQMEINNYISKNAWWLIDEAKEMEKKQIINACYEGSSKGFDSSEQYYNYLTQQK